MKLAALLVTASCAAPATHDSPKPVPVKPTPAWGIVVHGGAGGIGKPATPALEAELRADLERALRAGHAVLAAGGSSVDAVAQAVIVLEDSPRFNAGKGAVFTHDGTNELDAAIMSGATLAAGSVAGVKTVKNPILLARAVMERSPHVMLAGAGADAFAKEVGLELVDPSYFRTEERWEQLQEALAKERAGASVDPTCAPPFGGTARSGRAGPCTKPDYLGTVGAVALDQSGAIAAATSTGGMTNKRWGRVGDAPIIGAGTYANAECGVSATGHGEYFIRHTVAHDICARLRYAKTPLVDAAKQVVLEDLVAAKGEGGIIAMDRDGNMALTFNSARMYRGSMRADGVAHVALYRDQGDQGELARPSR